MSNKEAKDLLQGKALGCLDPEENETLTRLMEEDIEFPWQELGQYQNLVAFLPTLLDIETPDLEVKDNVARRLYEYGEKIKAEEITEDIPESEPEIDMESDAGKIEQDGVVINEKEILEPEMSPGDVTDIETGIDMGNDLKAINDEFDLSEEEGVEISEEVISEPEAPIEDFSKIESEINLETNKEELEKIEEEDVIIKGQEISEPEVPVEDPSPDEKPPAKKGISFREHGVLQGSIGKTGKPEEKILPKQQTRTEPINRSASYPKGLNNKKVKSYVSKIQPVETEESRKLKKLALIALITSIVALVLIIIFYFKLSSDIQENREEIQNLKGQTHSSILYGEKFDFKDYI